MANPSFLRPIPGGLAYPAAGPGLRHEFEVFRAEQRRPFDPERWGVGLGPRGQQCALFATLAFLGFAHDRRWWPPWQTTKRPEKRTLGATLFFRRREDGSWSTRLRSRLVGWVWHLRQRLGYPWERCLFLVRYLRPVVLSVAAAYARSGARDAGRPCPAAACRRLLWRAAYNLQRLATAEQSWHPKDADLALTWWDLQAARTLAAGRYLRRYPTAAAEEAAGAGARYQALADLVVLCLLSLTPQPRSSILRRLQFGVTLRREEAGGRWWLDLSNPFELASVHKTARFYYDREYVQPLPLQTLRRCGHDGPGAARDVGGLLGWVLPEWRALGRGLGTRGFVFSCRYPGLGRGRGRGALVIADDELQARLTGALVRAGGVPPARARTLHVWQLRKLAETFLARAGDEAELQHSYCQYFGRHGADPAALAPVHQLTAALHQHCQRTAQRRYLYHLIFRERLRALLDDFDSFWARALVYDAAGDEVRLDPDLVRAWLGGGPGAWPGAGSGSGAAPALVGEPREEKQP